jgi:F0F1-type ATP synthase assembly protein I
VSWVSLPIAEGHVTEAGVFVSKDEPQIRKVGQALAAVTEVFSISLIGLFLGYLLDRYIKVLPDLPIFTVILGIIFLFFGFYRLYLFYVRSNQD